MSTDADLMGLGMPAALASRLGNSVVTVAATGTTSGTAAALSGGHTFVISAADSSHTGVILPAGGSIGEAVTLTVTSTQGVTVYPPTGATFNTSASTTLSLAQFKTALITRLSTILYAVNLTG